MAELQKLVDSTFDESLKDFQNCEAAAGDVVRVTHRIGLSKSVKVNGQFITTGTCPSDIVWYNSKEHFTLVAMPTGAYNFNREDVEDNSSIKKTTSGQTSITNAYTLKADYMSELIQMLQQIQINDGVYGLDTELLKAYANGGFHLSTTIEYLETGLQITSYALNVKVGELPDLLKGFDTDTEISFEFLVEYGELFEITGNIEQGFGINEGLLSMATTQTYATNALTVTATVAGTGADKLYGSTPQKNVYVAVFNESKGDGMIGSGTVSSVSKQIPLEGVSPGDKLRINYFYKPSNTLLMLGKTVNLTTSLLKDEVKVDKK